MLKCFKYIIIAMLICFLQSCIAYVATPAYHTGMRGRTYITDHHHGRKTLRYRYMNKRVCKRKHFRNHCHVVRIRIPMRQ